jgi:hypothetical protein
MSPELREIVEKAYAVFSSYQPGRKIRCMYENDKLAAEVEAALVALPLRDISKDLLTRYNDDACAYGPLDTWWPYYLPRYFELIAGYEFPTGLGAESALRCLACSGYREDLPKEQVAVVDSFGIELLRQFICEPVPCLDPDLLQLSYCHSHYEDAYSILSMLVGARIPLPELLACWDHLSGRDPDRHLASLVNDVYSYTAYAEDPALVFVTGEGIINAGAILADWLATANVRRRLEVAFFNTSKGREQVMFSSAVERVSQLAVLRRM